MKAGGEMKGKCSVSSVQCSVDVALSAPSGLNTEHPASWRGTRRYAVANRTLNTGFTLVELLTVIAIIGLLAGIVLGVAGYASRKSDQSKAVASLEQIKNALEDYRIANGAYPTSYVVFTNMVNAIQDMSAVDPWGNAWKYTNKSRYVYLLWSTGPSTTDQGDDIKSWEGQ